MEAIITAIGIRYDDWVFITLKIKKLNTNSLKQWI